MDNNQRLLIEILSAAIRGHKKQININEEYNWRAIFEESRAHQVHALMYPAIKSQKFYESLNNELITEWKKYTILAGMQQSQHIKQMGKVLGALTKVGIEVIALKGLVLRGLYPQPEFRTMSDSDIILHEKDIDCARELLIQMGYSEKDSNPMHIGFCHENHLTIELHWLPEENDNIKGQEDFEKSIWKTAVPANICGVQVLTLSLENQILYICQHMAKHIETSGFGLRQLCDLVVLVESTADLIDWNLVSKKSKNIGNERFIHVIFMVCRELFNMKIPKALYCQALENDPNIELFINEIFANGVFGKRNVDRTFTNMLLPFRDSEDITNMAGKLKCLISILFPYGEKCISRYSYARKFPLLTPIAWIHRFFYNIFRKDSPVFLIYNFLFSKTSTTSFYNRDKLLQWLDL